MTQTDTVWPQITNVHHFTCICPEQFTEDNYGDNRFRAPEVILGEPYNTKSDVWTFGVIIFYMLTFDLPFKDERESSDSKSLINLTQNQIKDIIYKANLTETADDLLQRILMKKFDKRSSINAVLKHAWFQKEFFVKKNRDHRIDMRKSKERPSKKEQEK